MNIRLFVTSMLLLFQITGSSQINTGLFTFSSTDNYIPYVSDSTNFIPMGEAVYGAFVAYSLKPLELGVRATQQSLDVTAEYYVYNQNEILIGLKSINGFIHRKYSSDITSEKWYSTFGLTYTVFPRNYKSLVLESGIMISSYQNQSFFLSWYTGLSYKVNLKRNQ